MLTARSVQVDVPQRSSTIVAGRHCDAYAAAAHDSELLRVARGATSKIHPEFTVNASTKHSSAPTLLTSGLDIEHGFAPLTAPSVHNKINHSQHISVPAQVKGNADFCLQDKLSSAYLKLASTIKDAQ
jgi:hypothetical protein